MNSGVGEDVRQLAIRGAGITLLAGGIGLALQVVSTIVLARLLMPRDFGLVTMVTTFSLLLVSFGENGLPEAVVQREDIDQSLASALFWFNVGAGLLLMILFAVAGSVLARFYHDVVVQRVAMGMSLTILITSTSVLHLSLLKRAMRFTEVSIITICARVISVVLSIILGYAGWEYWALVAAAIALPLCQSIGAWFLCQWVPGVPKIGGGFGSTLKFAAHTYARFGVNYFTRNADNILVGWRFNAISLGFYKKAYDLFAISAGQFVHSLTIVAVGALSRVNRQADVYRRYLLGALMIMAFGGMGLAVNLTLVGKDLIRLLLGPGWEEAGRIFTYFGPGIGAMMIYETHGWIHLSSGRADRWLRWGIVEFAVTVMLFVIGLALGPAGVALAWTVSFWVLLVPGLWYAGKPIGFGVGAVIAVIWKYILAALIAASVTIAITYQSPLLVGATGAHGALLRIAVVSTAVWSLYLAGIIVLFGNFDCIYQMGGLLWSMIPGKRPLQLIPATATRSTVDRLVPSERPLVSILMPAYNSEEWIAEAIGSAIAQTWEPKEIIVVDDGSTDGTLAIARQFESAQVRVVYQKNQGASAARNRAFGLSRGEYIQWLDADDLMAVDKVERQMNVAIKCPSKRTLLSAPWGQFWNRYYRARFVPTKLWSDLSPVEFLLYKMGDNLFMQTSTWLVSRELSEAAGPWDTRLSVDDDGEYFGRVLLASDGIRFVPDAKIYYRYSGTSGLNYIGRSHKKMESLWRSMQLHVDYLRSMEESERVRAACVKYLQTNLIYFYPERRDIIDEVTALAAELGTKLEPPRLSSKFSWVQLLFGWNIAIRAQVLIPHLKWAFISSWDRMLFRFETQFQRNMVDQTAEPLMEEAIASGEISRAVAVD